VAEGDSSGAGAIGVEAEGCFAIVVGVYFFEEDAADEEQIEWRPELVNRGDG
jgi:hypothetical protein